MSGLSSNSSLRACNDNIQLVNSDRDSKTGISAESVQAEAEDQRQQAVRCAVSIQKTDGQAQHPSQVELHVQPNLSAQTAKARFC